ncbi:MAG TPA: hypothetical protein DCZ92_12400, partial [Elusimicrobia bacterium]|nr:hypothetical protein [Elusimicrobiota bacterium]
AVIGVILCAVISEKFGWHPTFTTIGICAAAGGVAGMMLRSYLDDAQKASNTNEFLGTQVKPQEQEKPLPQILPPDDQN